MFSLEQGKNCLSALGSLFLALVITEFIEIFFFFLGGFVSLFCCFLVLFLLGFFSEIVSFCFFVRTFLLLKIVNSRYVHGIICVPRSSSPVYLLVYILDQRLLVG